MKIMTRMMMMMMLSPDTDWFDDYDDEDLEYPFLPCSDRIWTPTLINA